MNPTITNETEFESLSATSHKTTETQQTIL